MNKTIIKYLKQAKGLLFILFVSIIFSACGSDKNEVKSLTETGKQVVENKEIETDTDITTSNIDKNTQDQVVNGMNEFATKLYQKLETGENLFFSPYSITVALSMMDNGAAEETKMEMEQTLGIKDLDQWNMVMQQLQNSFTDKKAVLNTANSVWFTEELELSQAVQKNFFEPLGLYYNADAYTVDFRSKKTLDQINKWVSNKTQGMIDPLLNDLSESAKMCLVNAVYFDGQWQTKFKQENTYEQIFHGKQQEKNVTTMNQYNEKFRYMDIDKLRGVELPYGDGNIVMDIWIPTEAETKGIHEILDEMSTEEIMLLNQNMDQAKETMITRLTIPKFQMETEQIMLKDVLSEMGMKQAFDQNTADLTRIAENLFIDKIIHKAKIEVDEEGTRAAAATAIIMETTSAMIDVEPLEFIVDQPFYYVIRDVQSGSILFMGTMYDIN